MNNKISKHVSISEIVHSNTALRKGILNTPDEVQLNNITVIAEKVFEPLRTHFNVPIYISSCFRSEELNKAIGGATTSQHMANKGAAMDLDADRYRKVTNEQLFAYIKDNLVYDQLIAEGVENGHVEWVHVSYNKEYNRNQTLIMYREKGKTKYLPFTVENYTKYIK